MSEPVNWDGRGEAEFAEMEHAILASTHGAWFLAELRRRQAADESQRLLDAVERLERSLKPGPMAQADIAELAANLLAGRDYMESVRNYNLADGGAVPWGETVYAHVAAAAETVELGLQDASEALRLTASALSGVAGVRDLIQSVATQIAHLDTLAQRQNVLARRVASAMGTLAMAEERVLAHLPAELRIGLQSPDLDAAAMGIPRAFDVRSESAHVPEFTATAYEPAHAPHHAADPVPRSERIRIVRASKDASIPFADTGAQSPA